MKAQSMSIIRVGDTVKLIDPRKIQRIGYEVTAQTLLTEVETDPKVIEFCREQTLTRRSQERVILAIATSRMHHQMKTGAPRKIFYSEIFEYMKGNTYQVEEKKIRYSGTFYHGYSGYSYYGECDYEPAGLDNRLTHICLRLSCAWLIPHDSYDEWEGFWVTTDQVEKV